MISETEFSHKFTSLWNQVLPMGEGIVRRLNADSQHFAPEVKSGTAPQRRGYVNELAFRIFAAHVIDGELQYPTPKSELLTLLERQTSEYIAHRRSSNVVATAARAEREEALTISRRLYRFFVAREAESSLQVAPEFSGCGILNTCAGDVYAEPTLYEVKAGARDFRLVDVRQVVTYCALNFDSRRYNIQTVVLVNPRLGTYAALPIHEDVSRASGLPAAHVYSQILDFLSQDLTPNYGSRV